MANAFLPVPALLEEVIVETPTIRTFVLRPRGADPVPGRPVRAARGARPRRGPLHAVLLPASSPSGSRSRSSRPAWSRTRLHELEPGVTLGMRGPFGKGYPVKKLRGPARCW